MFHNHIENKKNLLKCVSFGVDVPNIEFAPYKQTF